MIFCSATNTVVGTLGWVDRGCLWSFNVDTQKEGRIEIEDAEYLSLSRGQRGLFRLVHHQGTDPAVSIRSIAEPGKELASLHVRGGKPFFAGDMALWEHVEPTFISHTKSGAKLFFVDGDSGQILDVDLSWYAAGNYDLGYQGLTDAMTLKEAGLIVVSVQRSSELVLIDFLRNEVGGRIRLAGRGGNPQLLRHSDNQFLASDYDTMCQVDISSRSLSRAIRLQASERPGTQLFIGDYDLDWANHIALSPDVVVARPFSSDVVKLNADLAIVDRVPVSGQPLTICVTSKDRFLTRDWKTGKVELGMFSPSL